MKSLLFLSVLHDNRQIPKERIKGRGKAGLRINDGIRNELLLSSLSFCASTSEPRFSFLHDQIQVSVEFVFFYFYFTFFCIFKLM